MGRLYMAIGRWLSGVGRSRLTTIAERLSARFSFRVPASVEGIMNGIRTFVADNPLKALVLTDLLVTLGFEAYNLVDGDGSGPALIPHDAASEAQNQMVQRVRDTLARQRAKLTGDANEETVHGMQVEEYREQTTMMAVILQDIDLAARALGSMEILEAVRRAVHYEDEDFRTAKQLRRIA